MSGHSGPRGRAKLHTGQLVEVAEIAARRRLALGLTQAGLADLAGVGLSSVHALEAGRETLTLAVAVRILDALGLAVAVGPQSDLSRSRNAVLLRPPDVASVKGPE